MASIATFGLSSIQIGAVQEDGSMDPAMKSLGLTYQDTCRIYQDEPVLTEHYAEEFDEPVLSSTQPGKMNLSFSLMNPDAEAMSSLFGGTVTQGKWNAPLGSVSIQKCIKVIPKSGFTIEIPRASVLAKINGNFSKKGIFLIDVVATVLNPGVEGKAKISAVPTSVE